VRQEAELYREFETARPRILGALLDALASSLEQQAQVELARKPRMADFAVRVTAAEAALGWSHGRFIDAYDENRGAANDLVLEGSPLALAIRELAEAGGYEGTATDMLAVLNERTDESTTRRRGWPGSGRALSGALRRLAPNLRASGLALEFKQLGGRNSRKVIALRTTAQICDASDASDASSLFASQPSLLASQEKPLASQSEAWQGARSVDGVAGVAKIPVRSPGGHDDAARPVTADELAEIERLAARHADLLNGGR
jgi:hypothetical protein